MLRRKLLVIFGSLVALLVATAVLALWLFQGMLGKVDHINDEAMVLVDRVGQLNAAITAIQTDLYQLQLGRKRHLDDLIEDVEAAGKYIADIGHHYAVGEPDVRSHYLDLQNTLPEFRSCLSTLATVQDAGLAREHNLEALNLVARMREDVRQVDKEARKHAHSEQLAVAAYLRWLVLGIALGCVFVINVAIVVLLRAASMVLNPVDKLVQTSRELTDQWSDRDASVAKDDEFAVLARGYDALAERLQRHEERRMEMLSQVALTLNHELNNAIATIEMQLQLLRRRAGGSRQFESALQRIQESLRRMAQTVESLKHIRRIVLTDYISGVKMLDLQRSTRDDLEEDEDAASPRNAPAT